MGRKGNGGELIGREGMRYNTDARGRSLDLHRRPVSGYACLKLNENAMSVQLKVCAVNRPVNFKQRDTAGIN